MQQRSKKEQSLLHNFGRIQRTDSIPACWRNGTPAGVNYSSWQTAQLPISLNDLGIMEQGNVWFRKSINLAAGDTVSGLLITLGNVGTDADIYFNGRKLTKPLNLPGSSYYPVPASVLKVGANEMAVKVLRRWGIGGFRSKPEQMYAVSAARTISLAGDWKYKTGYLAPNPAQVSGPNYFPSSLFNGMVHPLTSMPVKGVVWYQGENNTNRSAEYASNLQSLIKDWRSYWQAKELPFLVVQLPNYNEDDPGEKILETNESRPAGSDVAACCWSSCYVRYW
jgi:sialate O-acetylesterase